MYIDFIKSDYSKMEESEKEKYIERDKKAYKKIIKRWIDDNINEIISRKWEIPEIKFINIDSEFLDLLKEAEMLYEFGCYTSCIALIGIASEDFTKYIAKEFDYNNLTNSRQFDRINKLKEKEVFNKEIADILHKIRKIRNNCVHFNKKFKESSEQTLKDKSLNMLLLFKNLIKELLYEHNEMDIIEFTDNIIGESLEDKNKVKGFEEVKLVTRNAMKNIFNVDLQIEPGKEHMILESHYKVLEIDYETEFYSEITLRDMSTQFPVCVDLTQSDIKRIEKLNIKKGDIVYAKIISQVSDIGQTEEWKLLELDIRDFA